MTVEAIVPPGSYNLAEGKWTFSPASGVLPIHADADPNDETQAPAPDVVLDEEPEQVEDETGDEDTTEEAEPE